MALKSKKSGFTYKPRTVAQVKDRASRKTSKFDSIFKPGFDTYRPKQGDNLIRYLPPTWDDSDHYGYTAFVHRNVGADNSTYLCPRKMLNKPCPICEAAKEAKDAGEADEAKELGTAERIIAWVVDRDADDPEKPLLYDTSWTQDRDIVSLCVNERSGEILMIDHPDKGYDVTLKRSGTGMRTKYYGYAIARDDSPIHDSEKVQDEILDYVKDNPVPETLNFYDYDYLKGVLSGTVAEKDEVLDKDEDEETASSKKRRPAKDYDDVNDVPNSRGKSSKVYSDPEEEEEPVRARGPRRDQEEEEEEAPPPRRSARKPVEEEEVDEDPPPRRGKARQVEEEEDEPHVPRSSKARRAEPVDEEVDEETGEVTERRPARRSEAAAATRSNGRSRVVEEEDEEDTAPPPRSSSRGATRVR